MPDINAWSELNTYFSQNALEGTVLLEYINGCRRSCRGLFRNLSFKTALLHSGCLGRFPTAETALVLPPERLRLPVGVQKARSTAKTVFAVMTFNTKADCASVQMCANEGRTISCRSGLWGGHYPISMRVHCALPPPRPLT